MSELKTAKPMLGFISQYGQRLGAERFELLSAIASGGSISAAAKQTGMSYKSAWDAVNALNNLFPKPLVCKRPGGSHGGGTEVTAEGRLMLEVYRRLEKGLGQVVSDIEQSLLAVNESENNIMPSLWSFGMKTSARNTFHGVISDIQYGSVNGEVSLQLSDEAVLSVTLTMKSIMDLGLFQGREAFALIKASMPVLMREDQPVAVSARNRIRGTVIAVEEGAVNAEVTMDVGSGKTLVTIVTMDSLEDMNICIGDRLTALIKSSQIILSA